MHVKRTPGVFSFAGALLLMVLPGCAANGTMDKEQHAGHRLGTVDFPVSCSEQAQVEFNRATALLHHMTYPQAREAFEQVEKTDPRCAMAHWGIAMTLFQPLWPTRPGPEELERGWEAVQMAKALEPLTERERLYVAATEAFFHEPASSDYWQRIRRWEQAMEEVYASFPQDSEAAAFYALAHLATASSDVVSLAHSERAAKLLLAVYERNPDHPGAMGSRQRRSREERANRSGLPEHYPRRFNSLLGAAQAARTLNDQSLARTFYKELLEVGDGSTRQEVLEEARRFIETQR